MCIRNQYSHNDPYGTLWLIIFQRIATGLAGGGGINMPLVSFIIVWGGFNKKKLIILRSTIRNYLWLGKVQITDNIVSSKNFACRRNKGQWDW